MTETRNWEVFTGGGDKRRYMASLNADLGRLNISVKLVRAGFNPSKRYDLLYDRESNTMGLREAMNGFKVSRVGHRGAGYAIACQSFCRHFGLAGRYEIAEWSHNMDDSIWALPLTSVERPTV